MARFIVRRLLMMAAAVRDLAADVSAVRGAAQRQPGAPIAGRMADPAEIDLISREYGFNKPIYIQYLRTMKNIFTGQAYSYTQGFNVLTRSGRPAGDAVAGARRRHHLAADLDRRRHAGGDQGRPLHGPRADGAVDDRRVDAAVLPRRGADLLLRLQARAWIPLGGYVPLTQSVAVAQASRAPWFTLSVLFIGFYSRVLRSTILDTINEDYVRTARAKGLSERQVLMRHILRNSLIPIVSLWGLDVAQVIGGGAILTETSTACTASASSRRSRSAPRHRHAARRS